MSHIIVLHFELKAIVSEAVASKLILLLVADAGGASALESLLAHAGRFDELPVGVGASLALPVRSRGGPTVFIIVTFTTSYSLDIFAIASTGNRITKIVILDCDCAKGAHTFTIIAEEWRQFWV